jgi:hypothetical protein
MKKKFKTIIINVELSSTTNLENITDKLIKNITDCAVRTVEGEKGWFKKENPFKIDSINVRQFPLNINENEKTL